jgi:hypothetical protein
MKRITLFVLLLLMELNLFPQNQIVNPGFESWLSATRLSGWTHVENCSKDSNLVFSGSYSCRHSGGTSSASDLGQTINVTGGKSYNLSLNYRTLIASGGNGARIWCYWKDLSGNNIADQPTDAIMRPSAYLKSDSWQKFGISVTAPASAVSFYLEVRTYANSITYWDDFEFGEKLSTFSPEWEYADLAIYPNPANSFLFINNMQDIIRIDILDLTGKQVWTCDYHGECNTRISLDGIPHGMYIIRLKTMKAIITRKLLTGEN